MYKQALFTICIQQVMKPSHTLLNLLKSLPPSPKPLTKQTGLYVNLRAPKSPRKLTNKTSY